MYKKLSILIVCSVLIVINIILLIMNESLRNELNSLQEHFSAYTIETQHEKGQLIATLIEHNRIKHPQVALSQSELSFIMFIPEQSCNLLEREISYVNNLYRKFPNFVEVYILGDKNSELFLEGFAAEFPYKIIDSSISIFGNNFYPESPISLLIDSEGDVLETFIPNMDSDNESKLFYQKVSGMLSSN